MFGLSLTTGNHNLHIQLGLLVSGKKVAHTEPVIMACACACACARSPAFALPHVHVTEAWRT